MGTLSHVKTRNCALAAAAFAAMLALMLLFCSATAQAAGYQRIDASGGWQFDNGKQTVYMESNTSEQVLYVKNDATGATKKLRTFARTDDVSWSVRYVYGNAIFLTRDSFKDWRYDTYVYNLKTKEFGKKKGNCNIAGSNGGKYVVAGNTYRSDVGPVKFTIYKVSKAGKMTKVKTIAKYGTGCTVIGKYIYIGKGDKDLNNVKFYRYKFNGKSKKKLGGTWKAKPYTWGGSGMVVVSSVTKTRCIVYFQSDQGKQGNYLYTYKTKKLKQLSNEEVQRYRVS